MVGITAQEYQSLLPTDVRVIGDDTSQSTAVMNSDIEFELGCVQIDMLDSSQPNSSSRIGLL